jgi:hypothetical protein
MLIAANQGHTLGYGDDKWTKQAIDELNRECAIYYEAVYRNAIYKTTRS